MLKIVYLSLAVLDLFTCCINLVSQFNWQRSIYLSSNSVQPLLAT